MQVSYGSPADNEGMFKQNTKWIYIDVHVVVFRKYVVDKNENQKQNLNVFELKYSKWNPLKLHRLLTRLRYCKKSWSVKKIEINRPIVIGSELLTLNGIRNNISLSKKVCINVIMLTKF